MKRYPSVFRPAARYTLALLLIVALPRSAPAPILYAEVGIDTSITPDNSAQTVDLTYSAMGGWVNTVQYSPDLFNWSVIDAVIPPADGSVTVQYLLPLSTSTAFFRLGLPQVQINYAQPYVVMTTGGVFYLIGQAFDPSYTVWIDGNLVSSTFINGSTIQVNVATLSAGFHTIQIRDSMNNVLATLSNGLLASTTGRTDQLPPNVPEVNDPNVDESGPFIYSGGYYVPMYPRTTPRNDAAPDPNTGLNGPFISGPGGVFMPQFPTTPSTTTPPPAIVPWTPVFEFGPDGMQFAEPIKVDFSVGSAVTGPVIQWSTPDGSYDDLGGSFSNGAPGPPDNPWCDPGLPPGATWLGGMLVLPPGCPSNPTVPSSGTSITIRMSDFLKSSSSESTLIPQSSVPINPDPVSALPKLNPLFGTPRINEATGELFVQSVDLVVPGRGLDFVFMRTYRSRIGLDTAMGVGWDHSYNIRAAMSGPNITVQDGQNRTDTYFLQSDGSFSNDELFRRGTLAGITFTLQFADKTSWVFRPLDGSPAAGKIAQIVDRNSNVIQFQYDGSGRLFLILDTLGRTYQISYDGANRIQALQDFNGRVIQYTHPTVVMPGIGGIGDLTVVRSQAVTGTPIGNDFPTGKVAQFTYSTGLGGARDHNLLTARDGLNVLWFSAAYSTTAVTTDFLYDRVASRTIGTAGEIKIFTYLPKTPTPANRFNTTKTIVNDAVGNVHESLFDSKNRLIDLRQFTGRSTPGVAVTEGANRPTGQLRPTDPAFFTTTMDWNRDSLPVRVTWPRGNRFEMIYQRDLDPTTNPRERANLRTLRQVPVAGPALSQHFGHQPGFGTREHFASRLMEEEGIYYNLEGDPDMPLVTGPIYNVSGSGGDNHSRPMESISFCISHTDARGFTWTSTRDPNGNLITMTRPDGVVTDVEHNANGQLTAIVWPQNNTGHRERDEWRYYSGGPQNSYLQSFVRDAGGLSLITGFSYNSAGCVTQVVDPRGNDAQYFVNQLNQVVQITSRNSALTGPAIRTLTNIFRDANNRVTSIDVQNKDEFGTVGANAFFTTSFGYDSLDHVISMTREIASGQTITTQYFYNAIRDLTEIRSPLAVTAFQPDARIQLAYDERNLPFTATAAPGSGIALRSTYTYDANGNLTQHDNGAPAGPQHLTTFIYDGFDRPTLRISPVGTQTLLGYNANHQIIQRIVIGTFLDNTGTPTTGTLALTSWIRASTGVCTQRIDGFFDVVFQLPIGDGARTTTYSRDPALNVTGVTDDNNHTTQYSYDGANRLIRVTDPKGNRADRGYDANSNVVSVDYLNRSDTAAPDQVFHVTNVYDGRDRLVTSTDNVGNARSYLYDSRSNRVRFIDPRNNLVQYEYDGLNRLIRQGQDMNSNSSGFDPATDIISVRAYDDNSRMTGLTNPNLFGTQYQYDARGRLTQRTNADATIKTWGYDEWSNPTQSTDENGSTCSNSYDNLNRLGNRFIFPGPGVSNITTFEIYDYPGDYMRAEQSTSNVGTVRLRVDSLGNIISEIYATRTTTSTYDAVGNLITLESPGGRVLTFAYDTANLCTSVALTATGDGDTLGTLATYNYIGYRPESVTHRNGTMTSNTYDGFVGAPPGSDKGWGRLSASVTTGPGPTVLDQRTYSYDANGNLTDRNDTRPGGPQLSHHYDYDPANRNTHTLVTSPGPTTVRDTTYNYDRNGNRLSVIGPGTPDPGNYTLNPTTPAPADAQMNQYTTTPLGGYQYDTNGNRQDFVGTSDHFGYQYDYRNQLINITNVNTGLRVATYQYDGLGRRVQRTLDPDGTPSVTSFFHFGNSVIEERNGGGAVTAAYSLKPFVTDWGMDPIWGMVIHPQPSPFLSDWQGLSSTVRDSWPGSGWFAGASSEEGIQCGHGYLEFGAPILPESNAYGQSPNQVSGYVSDLGAVEMRRSGTNSTYHMEVVPWLWLMTNNSGSAAERMEFEDFLDPHFFNGAGGSIPNSAIGNPYLFGGMRFDAETGLYQARYAGGQRTEQWNVQVSLMFDPKIGASLQRESSHATNVNSVGILPPDTEGAVGPNHY